MATLVHDLRQSVRLLVKTPGFTFVALATVALGIGANTAVFSVVNAALLRPLPYPDPDRLVRVREERPLMRGRDMPAFMTNMTLDAWREDAQTIEQIAGYSDRGFTLSGAAGNATNWSIGEAVRVRGAVVSPSLFPLLRARPFLGRVFTSEEEAAGNNRVAILSYRAWQTRYGGAPELIGALLTLDDGRLYRRRRHARRLLLPGPGHRVVGSAERDRAADTTGSGVRHGLCGHRAPSRRSVLGASRG